MISETKICQNCKQEFTIEPDDFSFYEKIGVPPPTFCPDCRKQRRLTWRNDTNLYSRVCDLCTKRIVSIYAPNSGMTVFCHKCWWSDKWDPKEYAHDYDFGKPFFEQYAELQRRVPIIALANDNETGSVNCEYTHDFARGKNCYMTLIGWKMEDCNYNVYIINAKEVSDALNSMGDCEYTYETVQTEKCYQCRYAYYSVSLTDCAFVYDCRDCANCFMCVGLRHKKYCFKNQQYSKEEYEKILADYRLDTYTGVERAKKEFAEMYYKTPRKFATLRNCVNCKGDSLINSKNSLYCFNVQRSEDCKWIENADSPKGSHDLSVGGELDQCYEGITPDHSYRSRFAIFSWQNNDAYYVDGCHSSQNLFGCCGVKSGEYCILNKQYSKEEYAALLPKVIEHMNAVPYRDKKGVEYRFGEFFPSELSYFGYNESVAQDYFPLTREEASAKHFKWQDELQMTTGKETISPENIPDAISGVPDSICNETLRCVECARNYRIIPAELTFYRRMKVPLPRRCFYCRHKARFALRNPYSIWYRACDCAGVFAGKGEYVNTVKHFHADGHCPNEFDTPFRPEDPAIVYCEECYNAEIV